MPPEERLLSSEEFRDTLYLCGQTGPGKGVAPPVYSAHDQYRPRLFVSFATISRAREMIASASQELDAFMSANGAYAPDIDTCLASAIASLPLAVQETVLLDVSVSHCSA